MYNVKRVDDVNFPDNNETGGICKDSCENGGICDAIVGSYTDE